MTTIAAAAPTTTPLPPLLRLPLWMRHQIYDHLPGRALLALTRTCHKLRAEVNRHISQTRYYRVFGGSHFLAYVWGATRPPGLDRSVRGLVVHIFRRGGPVSDAARRRDVVVPATRLLLQCRLCFPNLRDFMLVESGQYDDMVVEGRVGGIAAPSLNVWYKHVGAMESWKTFLERAVPLGPLARQVRDLDEYCYADGPRPAGLRADFDVLLEGGMGQRR